MIPLALDPKRHILLDEHPLGIEAGLSVDEPGQFGVYFHKETRNFVLFRWIGPGVVQEYLTFDNLDNLSSRAIQFVQETSDYRRRAAMREGSKQLQGRPRETANKFEDADREDRERKDWARRRLTIHKRDCPSFRRFRFA